MEHFFSETNISLDGKILRRRHRSLITKPVEEMFGDAENRCDGG